MTEQEARKIIGKITLDRASGEELEAINIAVKALEKQITRTQIYKRGERMTKQIKNTIVSLEILRKTRFFIPNNKELDTAIRSLQAWEEVIKDLEYFDVDEYLKDEGHRFGCNEGICYALELINQKVAEIEEVR